MLPDSFIEELRYKTDITQLVGSYVTLKRSGRNQIGLCPFHSEKSPSFFVYAETQSFYCFGCGVGGDIISFAKKIENLGYIEAIRFLSERAGLAMPENNFQDEAAQLKTKILALNREAAHYFHNTLVSEQGKAAMQYLTARGLTIKTIRKFGLGYAPDSWNSLIGYLRTKGFTLHEMVQASVVQMSKKGTGYDVFRNRIMFPIIDLRTNVIGFGGRVLDDQKPKYLNSPDTPVFKKSRGLFAMNIAKSSKQTMHILTEGYMDVISVYQGGFDNVVATLGTALTTEQARLLAQYTQEVVIAYDSDEAGQKATKRAVEVLAQAGIKTRVLSLGVVKDPDEYIKKYGAGRFKLLVESSANSTEYRIASIKAKYNLESDDGKVSYLREFCSYMAELPNTLEAEIYINREAREQGVSKEAVMEKVKGIAKSRAYAQKKKTEKDLRVFADAIPGLPRDTQRSKNIKYALSEDKIIGILLKNPDYFSLVHGVLGSVNFVTDSNKGIFDLLCSRLSKGQATDITSLAQYCDDTQISEISRILATIGTDSYTKEQLVQYIEVLLSFGEQRSNEDIGKMSQEEWLAYMKRISQGKK